MNPIRIDFYALATREEQQQLDFLCRLIEKAYERGHKIYVHCPHQALAEKLDHCLWIFKEASFIPHTITQDPQQLLSPILIGWQAQCIGDDILINLAADIPMQFSQFKRIAEIILPDEESKETSREHYKQYKKLGCELILHHI